MKYFNHISYDLSQFVGKDVDNNIKCIAYMDGDTFPEGDRKIAFAYYDSENDIQYLYDRDKYTITKQDGSGKIYFAKTRPNYVSKFEWNEVKE